MQSNRKIILNDRKVVSFILMRMQNFTSSEFSFHELQRLVEYVCSDFDAIYNLPQESINLFKFNNPQQFYEAALSIFPDKVGQLIIRKFICDNFKEVDFRSTAPFSASLAQHKVDFEPWYQFPSSYKIIAGLKFLAFEDHVVMDNGLLMEATAAQIIIEKFLNAGHHLSKLYFLSDTLESCLPGFEANSSINCSPICLDFDYLTMLNIKTELPEFKKQLKLLGYNDYYGIDPARFSNPLHQSAANRINSLEKEINNHLDSILAAATPVKTPLFFMSMGGVGSGKSKLEEFVKTLSNNNYVMFSVDNARTYSPVYKLLTACNNHDDDYIVMKEFAYMLFEKLSELALQKRINFFRDSSGIPYAGKNQNVLKSFKDSGFTTYCLVAASALYAASDRKDLSDPVHERIIKRFESKGRAVPWPITLSKHINHPLAQSDAALDCNLDHLVIFDTMVPKGHTHTIAESQLIDQLAYERLINASNLTKELLDLNFLPFASDSCGSFNYDNVSVHFMNVECGFKRILVIIDGQKFVDIIQKCLFNKTAKGYQELILNTMPWHMPSIDFPFDAEEGHDNYLLATAKDVQI